MRAGTATADAVAVPEGGDEGTLGGSPLDGQEVAEGGPAHVSDGDAAENLRDLPDGDQVDLLVGADREPDPAGRAAADAAVHHLAVAD